MVTNTKIEMDVQKSEFRGNRADGQGGAVFSAGGGISMSGEINFVNNSSFESGALYFAACFITFETGSTLTFIDNWADMTGGAVSLSGSVLHSRGSVSYIGIVCSGFTDLSTQSIRMIYFGICFRKSRRDWWCALYSRF